jgi:phage tail-like protein
VSALSGLGIQTVEPVITFNFSVEIEGLLVGGFTEVTGLSSWIDVSEHPEGGVNGFMPKLPGAASYENLTLQRGLTTSSTLWNWYESTAAGRIERKNGTLMLLDRHQNPVLGWNFRHALPVRWSAPTFNATTDQIGFESIELIHEGLTKANVGRNGRG